MSTCNERSNMETMETKKQNDCSVKAAAEFPNREESINGRMIASQKRRGTSLLYLLVICNLMADSTVSSFGTPNSNARGNPSFSSRKLSTLESTEGVILPQTTDDGIHFIKGDDLLSTDSDQSIALELKGRYDKITTEQQSEDPKRENHMCRRLTKEIWRDWDGALNILSAAYPYFDTQSTSVPIVKREDMHFDSKAISATIEVLGRSKRLREALLLLDQATDVYNLLVSATQKNKNYVELTRLESDMRSCYRSAITAAGANSNWRAGLMLLHRHMPERAGIVPNLSEYHSQLASCKRCGAVDAAKCLLTEMESDKVISSLHVIESRSVPRPDRIAYATVIAACSLDKRSQEAAKLLDRMKERGLKPGISEYNQVLSSFSRAGGRHKDAIALLNVMDNDDNVQPNEETYDIVIRCCGKDDAWDDASKIMVRAGRKELSITKGNLQTPDSSNNKDTYEYSDYFRDLNKLPKHGKGKKEAYWEIGRYQCSKGEIDEVVVGIQPNRNPMQNGLSLVFRDAKTGDKLGFMLLRHSAKGLGENERRALFSALIGMKIDESVRGNGLSSTFVAVWLKLCTDLGAFPRAEVMRKPLISVALKKFGFQPMKGGVPVEISPICDVNHHGKWDASVALFSPNYQSLDGLYRERDLRNQNIMVTKEPANPRGKLIYLGCAFTHPIYNATNTNQICQESRNELMRCVDDALDNGDLKLNRDRDLLKKAAFGFIKEP